MEELEGERGRGDTDALPYIDRAVNLTVMCCKTLVLLGRRSGGSTMRIHEALRELGLTLAAIERTLVEFLCGILEAEGISATGRGPVSDLLPLLHTTDRFSRRLHGGECSLFYHLSASLETLLQHLHTCMQPDATHGIVRRLLGHSVRVLTGKAALLKMDIHSWSRSAVVRVVLGKPLHEPLHASLAASNAELMTILRMWVLCHYLAKEAGAVHAHRSKAQGSLQGSLHRSGSIPLHMGAPSLSSASCLSSGAPASLSSHAEGLPWARRVLVSLSMPRSALLWPARSLPNAILARVLDTYYASFAWSHKLHMAGFSTFPLNLLQLPVFLVAMAYYLTFAQAAADASSTLMSKPDVVYLIARAWRGLDGEYIRILSSWLRMPRLKTNTVVRIGGIPCHLMSNVVLDASTLATLRSGREGIPPMSAWPVDSVPYQLPSLIRHSAPTSTQGAAGTSSRGGQPAMDRAQSEGSLSAAALPVPLSQPEEDDPAGHGMASEEEDGTDHSLGLPLEAAGGSAPRSNLVQTPFPHVLLYIHGGGFVAASTARDTATLADWVAKSDKPVLVVYPEYSLSPEARFPKALDELCEVYDTFRCRTAALALLGESAGGHLEASLLVRAVRSNKPLPRLAAFLYPSLNIGMQPSPSRALHMNDALIPYPLLVGLARAYMPGVQEAGQDAGHEQAPVHIRDPLLAPLHTPDDILVRFPPVYTLAGGLDPLLDDSVDFHTRLARLGVPVELDVARLTPHGFFAFPFLIGAADAIRLLKGHCMHALHWEGHTAGGVG